MAKFTGLLNNLFGGLTQPKGNLGDFAHASKLYTPDAFALAPKTKFLYHVVFNINPSAIANTAFGERHKNTLNVLVKAVDLPSFKLNVDTLHQYNRKKQVQTKIEYNPVTVAFHDDNSGVTTEMWRLYYAYYFNDSSHNTATGAFDRTTYASSNKFKYGLDAGSSAQFFNSIEIFQMGKQQYSSFKLVNPMITAWEHEKLDQSDTSTFSANTMTLSYEAVYYNKGAVSAASIPGFAGEYYDKAPSPLSIAGGGTTSLFGQGGIVSGLSSALSDLSSGNLISAAIKGANVLRNTKKLSSEGLRQEGFSIGKGIISATTGAQVGGLANTIVPKTGGTGQNTKTPSTTAASASSSSLTSQQLSKITNTPGAAASLSNNASAVGAVPAGTSVDNVMSQLQSGNNLKLNGLAQKLIGKLK